jgi:hypothetical protein
MRNGSDRDREFLADAYAALADFQRTGKGYALAEIAAYYRAKLQGRRTRKPKLRAFLA